MTFNKRLCWTVVGLPERAHFLVALIQVIHSLNNFLSLNTDYNSTFSLLIKPRVPLLIELLFFKPVLLTFLTPWPYLV